MFFLSHLLEPNSPTYGNKSRVIIEKISDMDKGDIANHTTIKTSMHNGTHIDMPYHFDKNGKTIEDYDDNFWLFFKIKIVEIYQDDLIINDNLVLELEKDSNKEYELLIIKTRMSDIRDKEEFWLRNHGLSPDLYNYLTNRYPNLRVIGFDSISISSYQHRDIGRIAHREFLKKERPILILEDMKLDKINQNTEISKIIISPLRVKKSDGILCTVIGFN